MDESCSIQTLPFSCIKMRNRYQNLLRNKSLIFGGHLMGGDRKETDEKEKIFEMVDRGGISGFHCRSGNICIYAV